MATKVCRLPKQLLEDAAATAIAGGAAILRTPNRHEVVARKSGQCHLALGTGEFGIDLKLAVDPAGCRIILLRKDARATAVAATVIPPTDHKPATVQRGDSRFVLVAGNVFIHPELAAQGTAIRRIMLGIDTVSGGIQSILIRPGHHKGAVRQGRHHRFSLIASHFGVDQELTTLGVTGCIVTLGKDALTAAVPGRPGREGRPGHHKPAATQATDAGLILKRAEFGIDLKFTSDRITCRVEPLPLHTGRAAVRATIIPPDRDKTTVIQCGNRRFILKGTGRGIDQKLTARGQPIRTKALGKNPIARAIGAGHLVGPAHDKTTTIKAGDPRVDLITKNLGIDDELRPGNHALRSITLSKNPIAGAVFVIRFPNHDITAIGQRGDRRLTLLPLHKAVDLTFTKHRSNAVRGWRDIDGYYDRLRSTAVTVAELNGDIPGSHRIVRRILIGEIFNQRFNTGGIGTGIERDHQITAVAAV